MGRQLCIGATVATLIIVTGGYWVSSCKSDFIKNERRKEDERQYTENLTILRAIADTGNEENLRAAIGGRPQLKPRDQVEILRRLRIGRLTNSVARREPELVKVALASVTEEDVGAIGPLRDPLDVASWHGDNKIIRLMLDHGWNADGVLRHGVPLTIASGKGHFETARILIENGASVNLKSSDSGETPIFSAVRSGRPDIVRLLLTNGADPKVKSTKGETPESIARRLRSEAIIRLLTRHK